MWGYVLRPKVFVNDILKEFLAKYLNSTRSNRIISPSNDKLLF